MKVTLDGKYKYRKVEFCCSKMGDLVMKQFMQAYSHTDHYPIFYVLVTRLDGLEKIHEHMHITYCPFCGAKIRGDIEV